MSIRSKLSIVALGFMLPICLLMYFFVSTRNEKIDFATQELAGDVYLRPLRLMMQYAPQHKLLAHRVLQSGGSDMAWAQSRLESTRALIEKALARTSEIEKQYGATFLSEGKYKALQASWKAVAGALHGEAGAAKTGSADESDALHSKLIADTRALIAHVGDKSNLILDPDLDSYYMMDLTLIKLPDQQDLVYQITALGELIITQGSRSDDEKIKMIVLLGLLNSNIDNSAGDYTVAFANNPAGNLQPALEASSKRQIATLKAFTNFVEAGFVKTDVVTADRNEFLTAKNNAITASFQMWDEGIVWLDTLLQQRVDATKANKTLNLGIVALVLLLTAVVGTFIMRNILRSIDTLGAAAKKVSAGDLNTHVKLSTGDEMGGLALSFNAMVESLQSYFVEVQHEQQESMRLAKAAEESNAAIVMNQQYLERTVEKMLFEMRKFAEGDLTVRLQPERDDIIATLFHHFNEAISSVGQIVRQVQESTIDTAGTLDEIQGISHALAQATRERSEHAHEISTSIEAMVNTITTNSDHAVKTAEAAARNEKAAQESSVALSQMTQKINDVNSVIVSSLATIENLGDSGSAINAVVDVIEEIAEQTNLLALNAAIEAARAGEAGRGFAVVADEVRKLADRTRQATRQIKDTVQGINVKTTDAVDIIRRSNNEMNKGLQLVEQTSDVLNYIATCSQEVLQMTEQIMLASRKQSNESELASQNVAAISTLSRQSAQADAQLMHLITQSHDRMKGLINLVRKFVTDNQSAKALDARMIAARKQAHLESSALGSPTSIAKAELSSKPLQSLLAEQSE
jgi:methyl-accepting chemotaxis protein